MTPEQQRIALAEFDGWKLSWCAYHSTETWHSPDGICADGNDFCVLPDYLNDLNAVAKLEEKLTDEQQDNYVCVLGLVLGIEDLFTSVYAHWQLLHATASQRCEALLKTIGLWKSE